MHEKRKPGKASETHVYRVWGCAPGGGVCNNLHLGASEAAKERDASAQASFSRVRHRCPLQLKPPLRFVSALGERVTPRGINGAQQAAAVHNIVRHRGNRASLNGAGASRKCFRAAQQCRFQDAL
jgi:hypothetical protein